MWRVGEGGHRGLGPPSQLRSPSSGRDGILRWSLPGWTENLGLFNLTPSELALQLTVLGNE